MREPPDTSVVEFHRVGADPLVVRALAGEGWLIPESNGTPVPLEVGFQVSVGDTVALEPGARLQLGPLALVGGVRGCAHSLVRADAFRAAPTREDLPRLVAELSELEREVEREGVDPLRAEAGLRTPLARATARDFALSNLDLPVAWTLSEGAARALGAVVLFVSGDTAVVALAELSVSRLLALLRALERPVQPHLVDRDTLEALFARVYGP